MSFSTDFQLHRFVGDLDGPHLLITAGVHGDEYLPMLAVKELIRRFEHENLRSKLRGTLTLIPIVNRPAFHRGHRCGPDDRDLARTCPGRSDGSATEQIAFYLSREIEQAEFYVDLHTGGTELCVLPLAGYVLHSDKTILKQQRKLALAFGLPLAWGSSAKLEGRSLSVARDAGVPAIYVEYLGGCRELSEIASGSVKSDHPLVSGCLNILRHLKMLDEPGVKVAAQEVIEDWRPESGHMQVCHMAPATGFLEPKVKLGQFVKAGDPLGEILAEVGGETHSVLAEEDGKVVVLREYPRIRKGDATAVVAGNHGNT